MQNFFQTFINRQGQLWTSLLEHMQLSFISIFLAVLIAVPLGIYLSNHQRIANPVIRIVSIIQTIPSLALLGLMIPIVGIGFVPAIIALTAYALLPILSNTYTGLTEIDPSLIEAADAMGMDRWRKLRKVQLPIAIPVIMAGIRTATVLIIGTATIAALIGAGGLGSLVLLGIDRADNTLILLGAIPAALLAIAFDIGLRYLQNFSFKRVIQTVSAAVILILGIILVPPLLFPQPDLVVAGKMGAEPEILMNMYKLLIEDETNLDVAVEPNFGTTQFVFNGLQTREVDIYPEFSGTILGTFFDDVPPQGAEAEQVFTEAQQRLDEEYDMAYLEPHGFNNTYTLAAEPNFAQEHNLETISDLAPVVDEVYAGFTLEFADRQDGYQGIQDVYGINLPNLETFDPQLRYTALEQGDVNLVDAYSTDADIVEYNLQVLEDDQNLFPPYHGAPLMRNETLEEYPELEGILNQLSGTINDEEMRNMNYAVDYENQSAENVARNFLVEEGLLDE